MDYPWHLFIMTLFYIASGINHFRTPTLYEKVIPPFLPYKIILNEFVGCLEIIFAILLLIPVTSAIAAWSLIILLILIFPANIYMLFSKEGGIGIPRWILFLRLFLQYFFLEWAYLYT
ncbi:DoxX family protein [Flavobacterium sp.]|uniref:DoxX family protein n=1 Tax=Flavobacterium sp. TaxID=239 RepID=UPI0037505EFE